jgi:hypothetical protein
MHPIEYALRMVHAGVAILVLIFVLKILKFAIHHPISW